MAKLPAVVQDKRGRYSYPPRAVGEKGDFYTRLAHEILAEYGRDRLEQEVVAWVQREARWLAENASFARRWRSEGTTSRMALTGYVQRQPWLRKTRTTKTLFIPTHYRRDTLTNAPHGSTNVLYGLYLRTTEHGELLWVSGRACEPVREPFKRALVGHLSDNTLALFWDKICRY